MEGGQRQAHHTGSASCPRRQGSAGVASEHVRRGYGETGQRLVSSLAAQQGWPLFTADVSQAFLWGLTFGQAAHMKDVVRRDAQFTVPPGSLHILQQLPGFEDYNLPTVACACSAVASA